MLTPHEIELIQEIVHEQRISLQAAAYTAYMQLTADHKKQLTQREFHTVFVDNWHAFQRLECEASDEVLG